MLGEQDVREKAVKDQEEVTPPLVSYISNEKRKESNTKIWRNS